MNKFLKIGVMSFVVVLLAVVPAAAQDAGDHTLSAFSGHFAASIVVIGAAFAICLLGRSAMEGMARQPEVASNLQTSMIIAAAFIEGFTFFRTQQAICVLHRTQQRLPLEVADEISIRCLID